MRAKNDQLNMLWDTFHPYDEDKTLKAWNALINAEIIAELERLDKQFSPNGVGFIEIDEEEATTLLRDRIKYYEAKETQL